MTKKIGWHCLFGILGAASFQASADLSFSSDRYAVVSGNTSAELVIQRDELPGETSVVRYRTVNGTALAGRDFQFTEGTLEIPAEVSEASFSIPLIFNSQAQNRSFAVELQGVSGESVGRFVRADVQILGADSAARAPGYVRLPIPQDTLSVSTRAQAIFSRESGTQGVTRIQVRSRPGAGFAPVDEVIRWEDGEAGTRSVEIQADLPFESRLQTIEVVLDAVVLEGAPIEGTGTFRARFVSPQDVDNGTPGNLQAVFFRPEAVFPADAREISLNLVTLDPSLEGQRLGYLGRSLTGADSEVDSFTLASRSLEGTNGSSSGDFELEASGISPFVLTLVGPPAQLDRRFEILVSLRSEILARTIVTVLGIQNDPNFDPDGASNPGIVSFLSDRLVFSNDTEALVTEINRFGSSANSALTVAYEIVPRNRPIGADFDASARIGTVSWGAGELGGKGISVPLSIQSVEDERQFDLIVRNLAGEVLDSQLITVSPSTLRSGELGFLSPQKIVPADVKSIVTFVDRQGLDLGEATVQYRILDGSAVAERDYPIVAASGTLSWEEGEFGVKPIVIPLVDRLVFQDRSLQLEIVGPGVIRGSSLQNVTLRAAPITPTVSGILGFERELIRVSPDEEQVSIQVKRLGGNTGAVLAQVLIIGPDGTLSIRNLSWADGDSSDRAIRFDVTEEGEYSVSFLSVSGAARSPENLTVISEAVASGGGAINWFSMMLLLMLAGARLRRCGT